MRSLLALIFSITLYVGSAQATLILDQSNDPGGVSFNGSNTDLTWQQEVKAGLTGQLGEVSLYTRTQGNFLFFVSLGTAWNTNTPVYEMVVSSGAEEEWFSINISDANIFLNANDIFVIGIHGIDRNFWFAGSSKDDPNTYLPGGFFVNAVENHLCCPNEDRQDIAFRTFIDPEAAPPTDIPEPSTLALFAIGLAGLGVMTRRRRKRADAA